MSIEDYRAAHRVVREHPDEADFIGERPGELVARAEATLGRDFPPSYHAFVRELGAGGIAGEEFYGVVQEDFEDSGIPDAIWLSLRHRKSSELPEGLILVYATGDGSYCALDTDRRDSSEEASVVVWTPGASASDESLEEVASSFGAFFRETIVQSLGLP